KLNLAYGLKLGSDISAGVNLHVLQTRLSEYYGNKLTPIGEASVVYRLSNNTRFGIRAWNIYPVKITDWQNEKLPYIFQAGVLQKTGLKTTLNTEIEQEEGNKTDFKFGLQYRPIQKFGLQAGFQT